MLTTCKQITDWSHHRREIISHYQSTPGAQGRKAWRKKSQGDANKAKLKGLVKDRKSLYCHLIIRSKNTGSWLTTWDTTLTSTVLSATGFRDFLCVCYDVTPPNLPKNVMAAPCPYTYITNLAAATEAFSLHVTTKCVMSSCISIDKPSHLLFYTANSSSIRAASDHRRRHVR